jgi:hypothetical protein
MDRWKPLPLVWKSGRLPTANRRRGAAVGLKKSEGLKVSKSKVLAK